eukprot:CAMPEP_0177259026 /NCGR_PEP_ID=MMETSP0367-20130122/58423_1 /TAXON_ID=447022 ORGANISM="Scrippsiella hangoei-like, Strain SHHI-4" /NCGR_SAMPLE_ID=MMETSP0367 /ASSEMBLY_ACC=CAM_ASM_000362 /LENGTH=107 /DNA_ID=CAMNT_0018713285 /DNA_START=315 /DNA_END=635 /DNA_ORIENTATION=+
MEALRQPKRTALQAPPSKRQFYHLRTSSGSDFPLCRGPPREPHVRAAPAPQCAQHLGRPPAAPATRTGCCLRQAKTLGLRETLGAVRGLALAPRSGLLHSREDAALP